MARLFQRKKTSQLPKTAVGGNKPPTDSEIEKMNKQALEKTEEYRKLNPEKPKSTSKTTSAPLVLKENKTSKRDEVLSIVKKILGKREEMDVTFDELATGIVKLYTDNLSFLKQIKTLKRELSNVKVYSSSQFSPSWN